MQPTPFPFRPEMPTHVLLAYTLVLIPPRRHCGWCLKAGEKAATSVFDAIQDTEAYVAANDDMIVVVFRGTKEATDWTTNLKVATRECSSSWKVPGGAIHEASAAGVILRS